MSPSTNQCRRPCFPNADEPPRKVNKSMSPSLFSSLPMDIVLQILARVPKRSYPILSCVSKNLRHLIRSPDIHKIRSLLGKDSLYICFINKNNRFQFPNWFTLRGIENNPTETQFASVDLSSPYYYDLDPLIIVIGPEIFFICGSFFPSSLWVFDSRSREFRQGPTMKMNQMNKCAGSVGNKIYLIGGYSGDEIEIEAESFDLKTQTWEPAPRPEEERPWWWVSLATVSLDGKVCVLSFLDATLAVCYDTRDGSCESFNMPNDIWWRTGACVIDNVLYVYYARFGLMWYDSELRLWRVVNGLRHLNKVRSVGTAEYYGKLAVLWKERDGVSREMNDIWCRMIALDRTQVGIHGTAESPRLLGSVPRGYKMQHCLSVSDS